MNIIHPKSFKGQFQKQQVCSFKVVGHGEKRFRAMVLTCTGQTAEQVLKERAQEKQKKVYAIEIEEDKK